MLSIKDLRKEAQVLAKALQLSPSIIGALLDLAEKKKIPKPEKLFKELVPKLNRKEKYSFTFLDLGQRQYFLLGDAIPLGNNLKKRLLEANKQLKKDKESPESLLVAFLELLEELPLKGHGLGLAKYAKTAQNEHGEDEQLLAVKVSSIEVGGKVKKTKLAELVRGIGYEPRTKTGELVYLYMPTEEAPEESPEVTSETTSSTDANLHTTKQEVEQYLAAFKQLKPHQAYKGLGLIHQMRQSIEQLDQIPPTFQKLLQQLTGQHAKLKPILSRQIDGKLDQSILAANELEVLEDTTVLDKLFETVQELHKGWKKFVPDVAHPKQEKLEAIQVEINWLKHYEQLIVPLRTQYEQMEKGEKREALRVRINELIEEANVKLFG